MKHKRYFKTALAISAGAVLFLACGEPANAPVTDSLPVVPVEAALAEKKDSVVSLGSTGYEVDLPEGYLVSTKDDTTFKIVPVEQDTGCTQSASLIFWDRRGMPRPGIKAFNSLVAPVLGQQAHFREDGRFDIYCRSRSSIVSLDSVSYLLIYCNAPPDARMETLFSVILSLRKTIR